MNWSHFMLIKIISSIITTDAFPNRMEKFINYHTQPKQKSPVVNPAIRRQGFEKYHRNKKALKSSPNQQNQRQNKDALSILLAIELFNARTCNPQSCHKCHIFLRNPFSTDRASKNLLSGFCFELLSRKSCCSKFTRRIGF